MLKRKVIIRVFEMRKQCEFPCRVKISEETVGQFLNEIMTSDVCMGSKYVVEVYENWCDSPYIFYFDGGMNVKP
ncbi:hypothetical protein [Methanothermobacter sp. K4]|uniref:hypothetical protein n=1 Tax=Methanothermobacter sp. K4 TaxID=2913262 RepID=UPI001EDA36B5|nr:hypothetical protein [Methanothermobacter sp. K4]MCG2828442.1 hypothetical protein [Methanothermobacter sp. K4]